MKLFFPRPPSPTKVAAFTRQCAKLSPNYAETGWTRDGRAPAWAQAARLRVRVGQGERDWQRAKAALDAGANFGDWVQWLCADAAPLSEVGRTVVLQVRLLGGPSWGLYSLIANRVLYHLDTPERYGFGYGTLAVHFVRGEERFLLERDAQGGVWFELLTFSRSALPLAFLAQPFVTFAQRRGARHYAGRLAEAVQQEEV